MKEATLQALITARSLLEQAERFSSAGDRYAATAGLIVLQDAFELVLYGVLVELSVDEEKKLESLDFDGMLAEVGKKGVKIPKSGTLRAMNKLRVAAKHYGQIMEPITVQGHMNASKVAIDAMLQTVIGKSLRKIFIVEGVGDVVSRSFLDEAAIAIENKHFEDALIATRKAFFLEFEQPYSTYEFRPGGRFNKSPRGLLDFAEREGCKAPVSARDPNWIQVYVRTPFDYIQIDNDTWKLDAMEWGINTQTLANIQRLTPQAVALGTHDFWHIRFTPDFLDSTSNRETAPICLDLTIESIRRKYEYFRSARSVDSGTYYTVPLAYVGRPVFAQASIDSDQLRTIEEGELVTVHHVMSGFDHTKYFYEISIRKQLGAPFQGFVEAIEGELPIVRETNIRDFLGKWHTKNT
jgi:hypothetical protein